MADTQRKIRWGILGTGSIAEKFAGDLAHASNGEAYAAGSRSQESAGKFTQKFGIPVAHGSYEDLVNDPEVEAVYIASPHPFHKEHVMLALQAGKAVLCEKPFTVNADDLRPLVDYARERKLFLMEAMWTRFLPPIRQVRKWLEEGRIGEVRLVKADFAFQSPFNPEGRLLNPELGGGSLLDAGIYPISFAAMVLGAKPQHIYSTAHIGQTGVDEHFSALLDYGNGTAASLNGGVRLAVKNDAYIYGTEGYIHVPDLFLNTKTASLYAGDAEPETFNDDRTFEGYAYEAEEVGRCVIEGLTESPGMTLQESVELMELLDAIRGQWGLRYPFE